MPLQPSIEILGVQVLEPITALTDLLVSGVCYYAFFKLNKSRSKKQVDIYFNYFFLTMGTATAWGGLIGHAFIYFFGFAWKVPGWIISMLSVGLMERSAILHAQPLMRRRVGLFFSRLNIIELITFICISIYTLKFIFVEAHATYGLLIIVFSFELYTFINTKDKGSRYILFAIGWSALSAIIHLSKFSIHQWFNYNDLSHVLMAIGAWFFYQGALHVKPTERKR